jgi:hypothetical protein
MIPPPEPFNERLYLDEGNNEYQKKSRVNKVYTTSVAIMGLESNPVPPRRKPPDQVKDIPVKEKRRHPVPEAPAGITFFRSCSRRPLRAGEAISESDDEVDDTWIKLRKSAEFKKDEKIPEPTKHFLKAFDNHMWEEQLHSDLHLGDALIRFVRQQCSWIAQADIFDAFKEKMEELLQDNIISETIHAHCLATVTSAKSMATEASDIAQRLAQLDVHPSHEDLYRNPSPVRHLASQTLALASAKRNKHAKRTDKGKGKAKVTDTGHLTPITADSDGDVDTRNQTLNSCADAKAGREVKNALPYDKCVCGVDAQASDRNRKSPMLACANMVRIPCNLSRIPPDC